MTQRDLNAAAHAWLSDFHTYNDSLNPAVSVPKFFTEDCVMQFPGQPTLKSHAAIIDFFTKQFTLLESMKHTIKHVGVLPDRIYQEASISYVVKGDPEKNPVEIQGLAVFGERTDEDRMNFFTVYLDPTPLAKRIESVVSGKTD